MLFARSLHAVPAWQHLSPQGVVPDGQHMQPGLLQASPALQHTGPLGCPKIVNVPHCWPPAEQPHRFPMHAVPGAQHWLPHVVVPDGHPHVLPPRQATPAGQQLVPQVVVPDGQPHWPLTHATPALQQPPPHGVMPALVHGPGGVCASAPAGRMNAGKSASPAVPAISFSAPRRDVVAAS
jgi:hypothetical protein